MARTAQKHGVRARTNAMTTVHPHGNGRVLAIDVRPSKIGFAAFDDSARLLDSATRKVRSPLMGAARVASLINELCPSTLILRGIPPKSRRNRPRTKMLQRLICQLARRSRIQVVFISEKELHACFQAHDQRTKHEIATLLANRFPELSRKLPGKRKIYEREPWSMVVFDAAALGVAHLVPKQHGVVPGDSGCALT
jgi:RNase H-fold protein (predicted Holliday junction resolvase)